MKKPDLSKCATLEDYYKQLAMYYCEKYNDLVDILEKIGRSNARDFVKAAERE
jgi:hypothetical protein